MEYEEYKESDYVKVFRHLATHLDAYFFALDGAMPPKQLKRMIMEYSNKPESTARAMIKDLTGVNRGLFKYDEEKDLLMLDEDAVTRFYENIDFLLDYKSRDKSFRKEIAELEEQNQRLYEDIYYMEKLLREYKDAYGDIESNSGKTSQQ